MKNIEDLSNYIQEQFENFENEIQEIKKSKAQPVAQPTQTPRNTKLEEQISNLSLAIENKMDRFSNDINSIRQKLQDRHEKQNNKCNTQNTKANHQNNNTTSMTNLCSSSINIAELLDRFQKKIYTLEEKILSTNENLEQTQESNLNLTNRIEELQQTISDLKTNKVDISLLDEKLVEKADLRCLSTKISRDDFDLSISSLTAQMEAVQGKVSSMEVVYDSKVNTAIQSMESKMDKNDMENFKQALESRLKSLKKLLEGPPGQEVQASNGNYGNYDNSGNHINSNQPCASIPTAGKLPHMDTIRPYTTFDMHSIRNQAQTKFRTTLDEREYLRHQRADEHSYRTHVAESMNYAFNAYANGKYSGCVPVPGGSSIPKGYGVSKLGRSCGGTYTTTNPISLTSARRNFHNINEAWREMEGSDGASLEQKIQNQFNRPSEEVELQGHNGHIYKGRLNEKRNE
jgi:phage shock protein A